MTGTTALISLGSNLGDRAAAINQALATLERKGGEILTVSSLYQTQPVGYLDQPPFLNACALVVTGLDATDFHRMCKEAELELGRVQRPRWHEREIDIDIILFGSDCVERTDLCIPHPRFRERAFVLVPAEEIAADYVDPVSGATIGQLVEHLSAGEREQIKKAI